MKKQTMTYEAPELYLISVCEKKDSRQAAASNREPTAVSWAEPVASLTMTTNSDASIGN